MGRQKGAIKVRGKVDGISFYQMEGKDVVRKAYGHSRKRIDKDPRLGSIKANITEFGAAGLAAGSVRMLLAIVLKRLDTGRVQNRLLRIFQEIYKRDKKSRPGQRAIQLSMCRELLEGFEFSLRTSFGETFGAKIKLGQEQGRGATIGITAVHGTKQIKSPAGATHFKLTSYQCLVSDYLYDPKIKSYQPVKEVSRQMLVMAETGLLELKEKQKDLLLKTMFSKNTPIGDGVSVLLSLGIEYYRYEKGSFLPLKEGRCLQVVAVF